MGRFYKGHYDSAGQTSGQGAPGEIRNHVSYSFATHVVFMDEEGGIEKLIAAHDSGRVVNRPLYEGQVQGGVVMGMGYALTESIPVKGGYLTSGKLNACGLLRSVDVPEIEVIAVEVPDPEGPCGAKGIGEIACIPTAPRHRQRPVSCGRREKAGTARAQEEVALPTARGCRPLP